MTVDRADAVQAPPPEADEPSRTNTKMAWTITGALVIFMVLNWADKAVLGIAAQPIKEELGLTSAQFGLIGSAVFFLFSISGLVVGFVANSVKTKWVLFTIAALWSATVIPVLVSASALTLLISRIGLGAAEGPAAPVANAAVFEWFPKEKRSLPSACIASGASIAKIAIAPVLTLIVVSWGWRAAFISLALVGLLWCLAWAFIGRPGPYAAPRGKKERSECEEQVRVPFRRIALSPSFIGGAIGTFSVYAMISVVLTWLPSYFEASLGFSRVQAGSMFGLPSIAALITMVGAGWLTDRKLSRGGNSRVWRGLFPGGALIVGGGMLALLPYSSGAWTSVAILVAAYGFMLIVMPVMNAVVSQITPAAQQPGALGTFLAVQSLAGLFAPALSGVLLDRAATSASGYNQIFQLIGLTVVVGGIIIVLMVDPDRDARRVLRGQAA
ncbi:MFS transporter [Rhodococcus sp. ABRD24]|uniref:MFS transporter n=1 Tax=Rhodococcus sp. ABRD24 TaxID=2507582 RepID=UPI00103D00A4|nr:MFS transporter [Rhodococcus sp. ABRD24]QBJ95891.1 MFS transporter [Rhodococcus sp. ABRD24]